MYKKLHTPGKGLLAEPSCIKGPFLWCFPGRVMRVTKNVYFIHLKNRKKPISSQSKEVGFFCSIAVRILADASQHLV